MYFWHIRASLENTVVTDGQLSSYQLKRGKHLKLMRSGKRGSALMLYNLLQLVRFPGTQIQRQKVVFRQEKLPL